MKIARLLIASAVAVLLAACGGDSTLNSDTDEAYGMTAEELAAAVTYNYSQDQVDFGPGPCSGENINIYSTLNYTFHLTERSDGSVVVAVTQRGSTAFTDGGENYAGTWTGHQTFVYNARSGTFIDRSEHRVVTSSADGGKATISITIKYIFNGTGRPGIEVVSVSGTCG